MFIEKDQLANSVIIGGSMPVELGLHGVRGADVVAGGKLAAVLQSGVPGGYIRFAVVTTKVGRGVLRETRLNSKREEEGGGFD